MRIQTHAPTSRCDPMVLRSHTHRTLRTSLRVAAGTDIPITVISQPLVWIVTRQKELLLSAEGQNQPSFVDFFIIVSKDL